MALHCLVSIHRLLISHCFYCAIARRAFRRLFLASYLYRGRNLTWLQLNELDEPTRRDVVKNDKNGYFSNWLAGRPVVPVADAARECLINWEGFGRLDDPTFQQDLRRWARLSPPRHNR